MTIQSSLARSTSGISSLCLQMVADEGPIIFESGSGLHLTDRDGRTYLDAISGIFVTCFGHGCRPIVDAMTRQLETLVFHQPLLGTNTPALELADALVDLAPPNFDCVQLVSGGSESIEAALRLVRIYHRAAGYGGKHKIISNYHGYHGSTYGALSLTGRPDVSRFEPRLPGVVRIWPPECAKCALGAGAGCACASTVERTIEAEGPDSIGAIVIEPVIHLRGMAAPPPEYLAELRAICDRHDILLIFDEIVTGFGRTGEPFAAQAFGTTPDIICLGKGLSGGHAPLAAVLMSERVSGVLRDERGLAASGPSHTYAGNPVSAAAGLAAVALLTDGGMLDRVRQMAPLVRARLEDAVRGRGAVRGTGLLFGVKLETDSTATGTSPGERVAEECLMGNLIVRGAEDWIVLAPAYTVTEPEVDEICARLTAALDGVYGG
jgi:beta-alanine--pyruvate transaminase